MPTCLHRFGPSDIFHNRLKTHPQYEFFIYDSVVYYNNRSLQSGSFTPSVPNVSPGFVNLYEMNIDRLPGSTGIVYPMITKGGGVEVLRRGEGGSITDSDWMTQFAYGNKITGSYPLTASITRKYVLSSRRPHVNALKNTFNHYVPLSKHYQFSSSLGDKSAQKINLISIPSIFYGSSIKKGSVDLRFYVTGTMVGQLRDIHKNGELIQVAPYGSPNSGSVAGVALYNEGFFCLTGAWSINDRELKYGGFGQPDDEAKWIYFGVGANDGVTDDGDPPSSLQSRASASFMMAFSGTHYVPNVTMMAHAPRGHLNWSNNPTYIDQESSASFANPMTGNYQYIERERIIANTVSASFVEPTASFQKTTYISKVAIYDEYKNVIGIATVATPVKKTEDRDLTFKLKLDI